MSVYIIGEIGQNHNGSVDIAKLLVDLVSRPVLNEFTGNEYVGMNAVKLTKRDLNEELSKSGMEKPYSGKHSFGKSYGEHRSFLELSDEEHFEVYKHAKSKGLDFIETICSIGAMSLLNLFTPDYLKVASRDLTNLPLLHALAKTNIPMIISTGMAGKEELDIALAEINKYHSNVSILHCVSEYPTKPENTNLNTISYLKDNYRDYEIGYSDHTIGISAPVMAAALGAKIIEKHITIDRQMKGTDQAGSLGPDGVKRMIRNIRIAELSFGVNDLFICNDVSIAKNKLERSCATNKSLKKDTVIMEEDLHLLSPGDGISWTNRKLLIGKRLKNDIDKNEIIYPGAIYEY